MTRYDKIMVMDKIVMDEIAMDKIVLDWSMRKRILHVPPLFRSNTLVALGRPALGLLVVG